MQAVFVHDGNANNAKGARAGLDASPGQQFVTLRNGEKEALPRVCDRWLEEGEFLVSIAAGGGGYGNPRTREPERVLHDVVEGLVTRERAEAIYGVAITPDNQIDKQRTAALRAA
jgi:N-methylhydantoinase B